MKACKLCGRSEPETSFMLGFATCNECFRGNAEEKNGLVGFLLGFGIVPFVIALIVFIIDVLEAQEYPRDEDYYMYKLTREMVARAGISLVFLGVLAIILIGMASYIIYRVKLANRPIEKIAREMENYLKSSNTPKIAIHFLQDQYWLSRNELFPVLEAMIIHKRIPYAIDDVDDTLVRVASV